VGARPILLVALATATLSCNWLFEIERKPVATQPAEIGYYWTFDVDESGNAYAVFSGNSLFMGVRQDGSTLNRVRCVRPGRLP